MASNCFGASILLNSGDVPPVQSNCCPPSTRIVLTDEVFTINGTTIGQLTIPTGANLAELTIIGSAIFRLTGLPPSSTLNGDPTTVGHILSSTNNSLELESASELSGFRIKPYLATTGTVYIHVTYFMLTNQSESNN